MDLIGKILWNYAVYLEESYAVSQADKETTYLNDKQNHTGHLQVLEEKVVADGVTTVTTYTIGRGILGHSHPAFSVLLEMQSTVFTSHRSSKWQTIFFVFLISLILSIVRCV